MNNPQKPLELILARNLLTSISTPSLLVDDEGTLMFYNEAAAALLGRSFEEAGQMTAAQWIEAFGPLSAKGEPIDIDEISLTQAVQADRPEHGRFQIRTSGGTQPIEASAFPLVTSEHGSSGAMIMFWPLSGNGQS